MVKPLKIGHCTPATDALQAGIEEDLYGSGCIFKNEKAFKIGLDKVCYAPKLSETRLHTSDGHDKQSGIISAGFI